MNFKQLIEELRRKTKVLRTSSYKFKLPDQKKIIIFDDEGYNSDECKKILNLNECFVLQVRNENIDKVYFTFKLLKKFLYFYLIKKQKYSIAYLCALISCINPKLIITRNDNLLSFSLVSRVLEKKHNFLAIQKAARYEFGEPFYDKQNLKKIFIPELASFGEYEIDLYKKYNLKVNNFFVCGSMKLSCFLEEEKYESHNNEFDICLIDENSAGWDKNYLGFEAAVGSVADLTIKFAKKNKKKLIFIGKRKNDKAIKNAKLFYSRHVRSDFNIELNEGWNSYKKVNASKVVIGFQSTLLREALVLKRKILSCNFTGHTAWDFPLKGICQLNNNNYDEFEKRVFKLLDMNFKEYEDKLSNKISYLINNDLKSSTNHKLKRRIYELTH